MSTTKKSLISAKKVSSKKAEVSGKTKGQQVNSMTLGQAKMPSARMAVSARKASSPGIRLPNHNQTLR